MIDSLSSIRFLSNFKLRITDRTIDSREQKTFLSLMNLFFNLKKKKKKKKKKRERENN